MLSRVPGRVGAWAASRRRPGGKAPGLRAHSPLQRLSVQTRLDHVLPLPEAADDHRGDLRVREAHAMRREEQQLAVLEEEEARGRRGRRCRRLGWCRVDGGEGRGGRLPLLEGESESDLDGLRTGGNGRVGAGPKTYRKTSHGWACCMGPQS